MNKSEGKLTHCLNDDRLKAEFRMVGVEKPGAYHLRIELRAVVEGGFSLSVANRTSVEVKSPDKFQPMTGFNSCTGILIVIYKEFENMRWELIREAALTLRNCIQLLNA
jgi:hypothetical protein